jgi:prevent-host-death family protein
MLRDHAHAPKVRRSDVLITIVLMETIGAFEAKAHLASLLDSVAQGERITITRHGISAAMLVPRGPAG